jgi:hypothetical protein
MGWYFRDDGYHDPAGFNFWEEHHFFWGLLIQLVAFYLLMETLIDWRWCSALLGFGMWIEVDDWVQHSIQKLEIKEKGYYTTVTFWNWIFRPLYRLWARTKNWFK